MDTSELKARAIQNEGKDLDDVVYPFLVCTWLEADSEMPAIFGRALWVEMARCKTEFRYRKVAQGLSMQGELVRVSEVHGNQLIPVAWYPDRETVERETSEVN